MLLSFLLSLFLVASEGDGVPLGGLRVDPLIAAATLVEPAVLELPSNPWRQNWYVAVIPDGSYKGPFPDDHFCLRLSVGTKESAPLVVKRFESTYGYFELNVIDLTGDGLEEFVLTTGEGRGTHVRSERLEVLMVESRTLRTLLRQQVSEPCGVTCEWWYRHEFIRAGAGSTTPLLRLELEHSPLGGSEFEDASLIPTVATLYYRYDAKSKTMVKTRS